MDTHRSRRVKTRRRTPALLLAVTPLASLLVLAAPAVTRPIHHAPTPGSAISLTGALVLVAVAALGAVVLVLLGVLAGRMERRRQVAAAPPRRRVVRDTRRRVAA